MSNVFVSDIVSKDLKEDPPNTAGTVISEIEKFAGKFVI